MEKSEQNLQLIFYEILSLKLVILTNFWRKFGLYLAFLIFEDLAFLKLLMAKFGLFILFLDLPTLVWMSLKFNLFLSCCKILCWILTVKFRLYLAKLKKICYSKLFTFYKKFFQSQILWKRKLFSWEMSFQIGQIYFLCLDCFRNYIIFFFKFGKNSCLHCKST